MALTNPKLFGLNVLSRLSDVREKNTALQNIGINPQQLLWGEAVALVRSGRKPGTIRVKAELLRDGINSPDFSEIEFNTIKSINELLYDEFPNKIVNNKKPNLNGESQNLEDLRMELIKAKKKIQQYELN